MCSSNAPRMEKNTSALQPFCGRDATTSSCTSLRRSIQIFYLNAINAQCFHRTFSHRFKSGKGKMQILSVLPQRWRYREREKREGKGAALEQKLWLHQTGRCWRDTHSPSIRLYCFGLTENVVPPRLGSPCSTCRSLFSQREGECASENHCN